MVENHRDIRAQFFLNLNAAFGGELDLRAVDMTAKRRRVLGDFRALGQTENLKAAAIGQHRSIPTHEVWQATKVLDDFFTRTQMQMIGVTQNNLSTS